jgi:hypothetical protein
MPYAIVVLIALAVLLPGIADTAQPVRPQAEYSADSMVQNEEGTMKQKVFVTPTKERKETLTGAGEGAVMIFRYDTKVMWTLMPAESMYMEQSIGGGQGRGSDPSKWTYEDAAMGEETLNGVRATKYQTRATRTDGNTYGGFSWRTREGIPIKQDLLYKEGNDKKRMLTELTNVQIGSQDPKLFEIPEGFTKFDMGGMMGGMMSGMGRPGMGQPMGRPDMSETGTGRPNAGRGAGRPEVMTPQETQPATPETSPPQEEPSTMDKASGFMKGLFGR